MGKNMEEGKWQDQTDATLDRIEQQIDDTNKQEGFALNFREKVLTSLTKIDMTLGHIIDEIKQHDADNREFQEESKADRIAIKECLSDLPLVKKSLENHLHTHDSLTIFVAYPVLAAIMLAALAAFLKMVLHIF